MNKEILNPKIQGFIDKNLKNELSTIILKGSPFSEVSIQEIAQQIEGKLKAEKKLPTWFNTKNICYPKKLNLAQSSSEITAKYKANLVSGERLIDITGGFGIDALFFAKKMNQVTHCELNAEVSNLAKHNFQWLSDKKNIKFSCGNGVEILRESKQNFDWIYLDPSRRTDIGNKVFRLEDCQPNTIEILPLLLEKGKKIMLKTSPLLDLSSGISVLKNVVEIHIVAVSNDVKELLWILSSEPSHEKIVIKTINFKGTKKEVFEGIFETEQIQFSTYSDPLFYLYEPNAAIMKSGLFNTLSTKIGISKLHPNSHLYTSTEPVNFPGRKFKIIKTLPFKPKILNREVPSKKANMTTRNFPKTVAQLKKQLAFKDGGDLYLFFTTNHKNQKIVLMCEKVVPTE